jgi:transcriptional regulator with XRE-family HTH domain
VSPSNVTPLHEAPAPSAKPGQPTLARKELGAFLRAHRERTAPEAVGLTPTGRRRTSGLRREEVSALAGVGVTWYTWIEQGRVSPSKQVLEALARTLRLNATSTRHLMSLAGLQAEAKPESAHAEAARRLEALLASWTTTPAVLVDRRLDITSWNPAYAALWGDPAAIEPRRRNLMWTLAADPALRRTLVDWDGFTRSILACFRAQTAVRMSDARTQEIYAVLHEDAPDLADWWACQGVGEPVSRETELAPSDDVRVRLMTTAMRPVEDPEALLLLHAPVRPADHAAVEAAVRTATRPFSQVG